MAEEKQNESPTWKASELEPNVPACITLKYAKEAATGESKFGTWNLWVVGVENAKVFDRATQKAMMGYTGEAVCFPSQKLHERFLLHTKGTQEGVKVEVTLIPKKGKKGFYTEYETKVIEGGKTPPSNLLESHNNFIGDFKTFVNKKVFSGSKEEFFEFGQTDTYNLSKDNLEKLWVVYNE